MASSVPPSRLRGGVAGRLLPSASSVGGELGGSPTFLPESPFGLGETGSRDSNPVKIGLRAGCQKEVGILKPGFRWRKRWFFTSDDGNDVRKVFDVRRSPGAFRLRSSRALSRPLPCRGWQARCDGRLPGGGPGSSSSAVVENYSNFSLINI